MGGVHHSISPIMNVAGQRIVHDHAVQDQIYIRWTTDMEKVVR